MAAFICFCARKGTVRLLTVPVSTSEKSRDMRQSSLTVSSLLAAVVAGFAVSAIIGAPVAVAQVCAPGLVDIDGQCTDPDDDPGNVPRSSDGVGTSDDDVPGGTIQCTQHSCVYREDR